MLIPSSIRSTISVKRRGQKTNNEFKQGRESKRFYTRRTVIVKVCHFRRARLAVIICSSERVV